MGIYKLVDILEIPMWNTFPSKHTTYFFHICERVHLGILFMLTKTTKRLITIFEITIRKWNCVGIEYNRIIELIYVQVSTLRCCSSNTPLLYKSHK